MDLLYLKLVFSPFCETVLIYHMSTRGQCCPFLEKSCPWQAKIFHVRCWGQGGRKNSFLQFRNERLKKKKKDIFKILRKWGCLLFQRPTLQKFLFVFNDCQLKDYTEIHIKNIWPENSFVARWVKDPALSELWHRSQLCHGFNSRLRNLPTP